MVNPKWIAKNFGWALVGAFGIAILILVLTNCAPAPELKPIELPTRAATPGPIASPVPQPPTARIVTLKEPIQVTTDSGLCGGLQPPSVKVPSSPVSNVKIKVTVMGYTGPDSFVGVFPEDGSQAIFAVEYYVLPELRKPWLIQVLDPKVATYPAGKTVCLRWYVVSVGATPVGGDVVKGVFTPISVPSVTGFVVPTRPK